MTANSNLRLRLGRMTSDYYAQINANGTRWRLCSPFDEPLSPWMSKKRALALVEQARKQTHAN